MREFEQGEGKEREEKGSPFTDKKENAKHFPFRRVLKGVIEGIEVYGLGATLMFKRRNYGEIRAKRAEVGRKPTAVAVALLARILNYFILNLG